MEQNLSQDEKYMKEAIELSKKAYELEEIPIGCIIVYNDKIISKAYNKRNTNKNTLAHAEVLAINEACENLQDWRLENCTMYVTVEPCAMCSGAILQSRMTRLVYGTKNTKGGCVHSIVPLLSNTNFNHTVKVTAGVLEEECAENMSSFFRKLRRNRKNKQKNE